jgi:hypothetical protein
LPLISALHRLPVLPTIELVTVLLVPPTSIELDTLDELFEVTELVTFVEVLESIVLVDPAIPEPAVHRPSAIRVIRCLICSAPMLSPCRRVFRIDSGGCAFVLPLWRSTCGSAAGVMPAGVSARGRYGPSS